ncbi:MAG TPA: hypothetical protein PLS84_08490 [Salinivirgaceae bacterium]|nr:hypothetical protein [Salinivirgaceae bacterium]
MAKESKKIENSKERDFAKEYTEIFSILGINSNNIVHEWNKEGDTIKEFTLYKEYPTKLTTHIFPVEGSLTPRLTTHIFPTNR